MRGQSIGLDRRQVLPGPIARIALPPISWVVEVQLPHHLVPRHFRENRGRGDGIGKMVALDHTCLGAGQPGFPVAVDQGVGRLDRECGHRAPHGEERRLQDVDPVDLLHAGLGDGEDRLRPQFQGYRLAHLRREPLGIVERPQQPGGNAVQRQDRRTSEDRPRQRPAPHLIDTADHGARLATQGDLVAEGRHGGRIAEAGEEGEAGTENQSPQQRG